MPPRPYSSPAREAAAAATRLRVIDAALSLLRTEEDVTRVSLEVVAKVAGVTRLTVYNQFGSRRGLLEAVLDKVAEEAGFDQVRDIMSGPDPRLALERLIQLMCRAWSHDGSLARLHAAASIDPEFAELVGQRIERRRFALQALVKRLQGERGLSDAGRRDLVDTLFAITSYPVFAGLSAAGRSPRQVARLLARASLAIVDDALG